MSNDIVIVHNVRYRFDDARRLGLINEGGKVLTAKSVNRASRRTNAPSGLITSEARNPGSTDATKPKKSASTADWTEYALANGKTEDDLDGLKRDDIAALFDEPAGDQGDKSTGEGDQGDKSTGSGD